MEKELVKILKALADENRIRILEVIKEGKTCVCVIEKALGMTQSNVSRHLIKLRDAGVIQAEKKGQFAYYSINRDTLKKHPFLSGLIGTFPPARSSKSGKNLC